MSNCYLRQRRWEKGGGDTKLDATWSCVPQIFEIVWHGKLGLCHHQTFVWVFQIRTHLKSQKKKKRGHACTRVLVLVLVQGLLSSREQLHDVPRKQKAKATDVLLWDPKSRRHRSKLRNRNAEGHIATELSLAANVSVTMCTMRTDLPPLYCTKQFLETGSHMNCAPHLPNYISYANCCSRSSAYSR